MVEVQQDCPPKCPPCWPPGHKYGLPCKCQQACGQRRMKYVQPEKPISYKPLKVYRPPEIKMPEGTTYNMSYEAFDPKLIRSCRGKPSFAKENLTTAGEFSDKTTHKMSYGAWPGLKRPEILYPKDHKLSGEGPISEMTTNRHDYTPKPIETLGKIVQPSALGLSKSKMENDTVHTMSYKNPDMTRFEPPQSFKPLKTYLPPDSPLDGATVHKLSYMPWEPQPKEDFPWAKKGTYEKPGIPLDGNTIYNGSYIPPGKLEEDPLGHCMGCYCLYPAECLDAEGQPPKDSLICPEGYDPMRDGPRGDGPIICEHLKEYLQGNIVTHTGKNNMADRETETEMPCPVQGVAPNPVQYAPPNPVQYATTNPAKYAAPNPVDCTVPNPVQCFAPNQVQNVAPNPTCKPIQCMCACTCSANNNGEFAANPVVNVCLTPQPQCEENKEKVLIECGDLKDEGINCNMC